jgi:hypothetical protein
MKDALGMELREGDRVMFNGMLCRVTAVSEGGISGSDGSVSAPYVKLAPDEFTVGFDPAAYRTTQNVTGLFRLAASDLPSNGGYVAHAGVRRKM